jgi:hypothetical protein
MSTPSIVPNDWLDDLLTGQYDNVLRVVAFTPIEGWSRDASESVAEALEVHIVAEGRQVSESLRDFIEGQLERNLGQQLSLL